MVVRNKPLKRIGGLAVAFLMFTVVASTALAGSLYFWEGWDGDFRQWGIVRPRSQDEAYIAWSNLWMRTQPGQNSPTFAQVYRNNAFPASGNFQARFHIRYDQVTGYGTGISLQTAHEPQLADIGNILQVWQDLYSSRQIRVSFFGLGNWVWTSGSIDTSTDLHLILRYQDSDVYLYVNPNGSGWRLVARSSSQPRPYSILYGNPAVMEYWRSWTSFHSDYFAIDLPPASPAMYGEPSYTAGTSNTVYWSSVPDATAYLVQRATDPSFTQGVISSPWVNATSYTFDGLADGQTYYYRVRATDWSLHSAWSNVVFSTQDASGPWVAIDSHVNQASYYSNVGSISLYGRAGDSVSGLNATYWDIDGNNDTWTYGWAAPPATSWTGGANWSGRWQGLEGYNRIHVAAYDNVGNFSGWNWWIDFYVDSAAPDTPAAPTFGAVTANSVEVRWTLPPDRGSGSSAPWTAGNVGAYAESSASGNYGWGTATSWTWTGLAPNTEYRWRVQARDNTGESFGPWHNVSGWSAYAYRRTLANAPSGLTATGGSSAQGRQITVSWNGNGNPPGTTYELYSVTDGTIVYSGPQTSFVHQVGTGVTKAYRVRAVNGDGVPTTWSGDITGNSLFSPAVTRNVSGALNSGRNRVSLTWPAVPGASGYVLWVYNGYRYEEARLGNVSSWDSEAARIYPTPGQLLSWADPSTNVFRWDGSGEALRDDPNEVYARFGGAYAATHYYYWVHVAALDSQGRLSGLPWDGATWVGGDSLDRTPPNAPIPTVSPSGWHNGSFTFSWANPGDIWFGPGNVAGYNWHTDSNPDQFTSGSNVVATGYRQGVNTFYVQAQDSSGNTSLYGSVDFDYDSVSPATIHSLSGTTGNAGWWRSAVDVALVASDSTSGVAATYYRIDGGNWQSYAGPFTISGDGSHRLEYYSVDRAGNAEALNTVDPINIDTVPSTTSHSLQGTDWGNGFWSPDVRVTLTAVDATSGVAQTRFRFLRENDGSVVVPWTSYGGPFGSPGDGEFRVEYYSEDKAGNQETLKSFILRVSSPSIELSRQYPYLVLMASNVGQPTQVLTGRLTAGNALPGRSVVVRWTVPGDYAEFLNSKVVITDADGRFRVDSMNTGDPNFGTTAIGTWQARAEAIGAMSGSVNWEVKWHIVHVVR